MQPFRIIPVVLAVSTAPLLAQLPPSTMKRNQPAQPAQPAAPLTPAPRPGLPPTPAVPSAPAAPAETAPEAPAAAPLVDLSNTVPNTLTPEETAQGWKLLFDGTRLIGWKGVQKNDPLAAGWKIQNGELTLPKEIQQADKITGGDLMTTVQFWDFEFRFDWKATVSANSGVRYMVNTAIGQPPIGLEYQIIDDVHSPLSAKGGLLRRTGALDNVIPVGENAKLRTGDPLMKRGEPWNEGRIVVQGNRVEHWLNGEKVLEFALGPHLRTAAQKNYNREELFASPPHAFFGMKSRTPIVLVDQGTEIAFRNLKVRPLAPQAVAPAPGQPAAPGLGQSSPVPNPFLLPPKQPGAQR